ncbi:hypothetical protein E2C01_069320 [Portunus trituberculatus]|uniref:Uncharacterized protein n=1 Tax=Portunus trituberculatus TaxID=210409 RepID=A0A5B7HZ08_PORTR|nr:hypothetical protein [Portunus trituberculatus]
MQYSCCVNHDDIGARHSKDERERGQRHVTRKKQPMQTRLKGTEAKMEYSPLGDAEAAVRLVGDVCFVVIAQEEHDVGAADNMHVAISHTRHTTGTTLLVVSLMGHKSCRS